MIEPLPPAHPQDTQPQKRTTLVVFLTLLIIVSLLGFKMTVSYLLALSMGGILALLSYPLYEKLRARRVGPTIAGTLVTVGVLLVIITPITLLVVKAVQQGITVGEAYSESGITPGSVISRISHWAPIEQFVSPEAVDKQVRSWIQSGGKAASGGILAAITNLPEIGLQLVLALIACFFFLIDGASFLNWLNEKIPMDADVRDKVSKSLKDTSISVVWATLAAAAVQAMVMAIAYLTLGVPGIFLAAGATFIFAWIPILGSTPVWLVGAAYLYSQDSPGKMVVMLLLGGFASVADNFVRPLVLKGRGEMHPLVSLVAIFGGIEMFGIMGVFIGPIVIDVMIALLEIWPTVGRRFGILGRATGHANVKTKS